MLDRERSKATREALRGLLPREASVAVWGLDTTDAWLFPEEEEFVERAIERRREEFARGRACARLALQAVVGGEPVPIPVGEHREPLWPGSVVGSISHSGGVIAATVARREHLEGLGIDLEVAGSLEGRAADLVLTSAEADRPDLDPTLVFCAKEAVHKAVFPRTGRWLDFQDVEVEVSAGDRFVARAAPALSEPPPELSRIRGRFGTAGGMVVAVVTIPAR